MSQELLNKAVEAQIKKNVPEFKIGDTVNVSARIIEGEKERIQVYTGVVTARKGTGISETFTVRRIVNNEGVERTFPLHSPKVVTIEVVRGGKVRRAKLYYLRQLFGKATRLKEIRRGVGEAVAAAPEQPAPQPAPAETPAPAAEAKA